jgi:hypothetical protein
VTLDTAGADGASLREHLTALSKIPGAPRPPELDIPTSPPAMYMHLWRTFQTLSAGRQFNNGYPQPLSFVEIAAYSTLYGDRLSRFDLDALRELDVIWIAAAVAASRR